MTGKEENTVFIEGSEKPLETISKAEYERMKKNRQTGKSKIDKPVYVEPSDYFPKEIRKKLKLGEYADQAEQEADEQEDSLNNPKWICYEDMLKQKQEQKPNKRGKASKDSD